MENISLKSLVSQKTINEAEIDRLLQEDFDREVSILQENRNVYSNAIKRGVLTEAEVDEGILGTGWDAIKRAGAEIKRQYDISKRNGDAAAAARWEKKDAELKATAEKKAAAESGSTPTDSEKPEASDGGPLGRDNPNPELAGNPTSQYDAALADSDARDASRAGTAKAGSSVDGNKESGTTDVGSSVKKPLITGPVAANKPNIAASTAYQICGEIVKSLIKNTPRNDRYMALLKQAVTKNDSKTILAYFNKLQSGTTAKIKSEILKRYKQETGKSSKNYTGVIRKYIKTAKLDVASALALIDIVRGLAKMDIKDRATIIFRAFNNNGIGKRQPAVKKPATPTKPPAPVAPVETPAFANAGGNVFTPAAQRTADMHAAIARDADAQTGSELPPQSATPPPLSPLAPNNAAPIVPPVVPTQPGGALAQWNNYTRQFQPNQRAEMKTQDATPKNYELWKKAQSEWEKSGKQGPEPERLFGRPPPGTSVRYNENKKLTETRDSSKAFKRSNTNPNVFIVS